MSAPRNKKKIVTAGLVAGLLAGAMLNGLLIEIGGYIVPPPEGADNSTLEGLKASLHLFRPRHFIMPFLAHALGTLAGCLVTIAASAYGKRRLAFIVSSFYFLGGAYMVFALPAPLWFNLLDLLLAYYPMAWLALKWTGMDSTEE